MRVGVCGAGFGNWFLALFDAHPAVESLAIADLDPARRRELAAERPDATLQATFDELCADPQLDAIAAFTPPWLHADQTLAALRAGKHVFCAVPAALTLEQLGEVVAEVERSGRCYMMAETSTYYPSFLYCRTRYRRGDFGRFVYGDAQYLYHPRHYDFWMRDRYANFPPLLYATHSVPMIVGVTGSRLTRVAATGFHALHPSARGRERLDAYRDDDCSAESALFLCDDGGSCRITEARWVGFNGGSHSPFSLYGTEGSFAEHAGGQVWSSAEPPETQDMTAFLRMYEYPWERWEGRRSPAHPQRALPETFSALANEHFGSHAFLVDDFLRACVDGRRAFNDVWQAARFCAPGIVAHESARREGEWLEIPGFGNHPEGAWTPDALDRSLLDDA